VTGLAWLGLGWAGIVIAFGAFVAGVLTCLRVVERRKPRSRLELVGTVTYGDVFKVTRDPRAWSFSAGEVAALATYVHGVLNRHRAETLGGEARGESAETVAREVIPMAVATVVAMGYLEELVLSRDFRTGELVARSRS
jgi:hypothetical protein